MLAPGACSQRLIYTERMIEFSELVGRARAMKMLIIRLSFYCNTIMCAYNVFFKTIIERRICVYAWGSHVCEKCFFFPFYKPVW